MACDSLSVMLPIFCRFYSAIRIDLPYVQAVSTTVYVAAVAGVVLVLLCLIVYFSVF